MKQHFHEHVLRISEGERRAKRRKEDFFKRVEVAQCELSHLQKPGSETALSIVNQEEGQKSSLVGANAPDPDT